MPVNLSVSVLANADTGRVESICVARPTAGDLHQFLTLADVATLLDAAEISDAAAAPEVSQADMRSWRGNRHILHDDLIVVGTVPVEETADVLEDVGDADRGDAQITVELPTEHLHQLPEELLQRLLAVGRDQCRREALRALGRGAASG